MPKRRLDIERPLPMRPTQGEQTPRVARWCENVDATETDRLKGLRGPQTVGTGQLSNVVVNTSNEAWGVDSTDTVQTVSGLTIGSLSGTPVNGEGDTHGEAARWPTGGTPQWAGPHDVSGGADAHGQFPSSPSVTDAILEAPDGVSINVVGRFGASSGQGVFRAGYTYYFAVAWLYDGYQEGPITSAGQYTSGGDQSVTLDVVWEYNNTNPRVTDLILYVVESPVGEGPGMPDDLPFYFVRRLPVDEGWGSNAFTYTDANVGALEATIQKGYSSKGTSASPSDSDSTTETVSTTAVEAEVTVRASIIVSDPSKQSVTLTSKATIIAKNGGSVVDTKTITVSRDSNSGDEGLGVRVETVQITDGGGIDTLELDTTVEGSVELDTAGFVQVDGDALIEEVRTASSSSGKVEQIDVGGPQAGSLVSGQTYQERTGISRAVAEDTITSYQHAVSAGPYRAVAGPEIDARIGAETTNQAYVLRSKAYRPDMFDWATDFAQVGERVEALAAAEGHVLAFCTTHTYVIERNEWRVVDVLNNVSAFGPSAYVNTGRGLVFCDANGVYLWTPQDGYRSLDGPIYEVSLPKPQYNGTVTASTFEQLTYAPDPEMVTLLYASGTAVKGWALYLPASRSFDDRAVPYWTHVDPGLSGGVDSAYMQGGEAYAYVGGDRVQLFSGGRLGWTWTSPPLRPGGYGREGTFYRADVIGTASTLTYREDEDGSFQSAPLSSGGTSGHPQQATINSGPAPPWTRVTRLEVQAEGAAGEYLSALSLTHRPQRAAADT